MPKPAKKQPKKALKPYHKDKTLPLSDTSEDDDIIAAPSNPIKEEANVDPPPYPQHIDQESSGGRQNAAHTYKKKTFFLVSNNFREKGLSRPFLSRRTKMAFPD